MGDAWTEHDAIWLSPSCGECDDPERSWCNSPQDACEHCGREWTKFQLASPTPDTDPDRKED